MEEKQIHIVINTLWYYGVKVLKYRPVCVCVTYHYKSSHEGNLHNLIFILIDPYVLSHLLNYSSGVVKVFLTQ